MYDFMIDMHGTRKSLDGRWDGVLLLSEGPKSDGFAVSWEALWHGM